ncbi:acyl-CoA N-acyltransferase [Melanomma pulvis-pyrius CBS 109.77]|uniref:Acyl-CoA N-acyltransferase n=1 Tax=Melanomma pulvis-pyrius CBS 109.77 TaxID=1314802 RepID=A0A6A6XTC1_9PLEO|nr:acyl-CoA N-acyltransferase [Melanomma pulvis-pyrius CBS 109.77]
MSVVVEQYNPEWPSHFKKIKSELEIYLKDVTYLSIEHVGSTSVPGLDAKPIIDINIIVARPNTQPVIDALVTNNFMYLGELGCVDRHALRSPNQSPPRNIYVGVDGAFQTRNHLGVRDTLRSHPKLRDEYANVKLELAARGIDIVEYVEAKSEVIQRILEKAGLLSEEERTAVLIANEKGERIGATKTERLVLREFVMGDVQAFHGLESREEVVRYQTWPPRTLEQAQKEVVATIRSSFEVPRNIFELAVTHDDQFIGRDEVSAEAKKEDEEAAEPRLANLWFSFLPESQGKGFATEAMKAFIPLLRSPAKLEIECDPRNTSSWKLAERLGFEKISLTEKVYECKGEWVDSLIYQKTIGDESR